CAKDRTLAGIWSHW
nr:immunoglobulin heavy chain junction region [Macaca mulatta]MPN83921.1 immunoglobulin heavy chain junction region [Macaca mulatta]MPN84079.1 immunoglobulin heavy chain junction region [Macaca mulatta]MPN84154.1 immunoglobulin heavy chain junction region [Macaca mulatta]MPN84425.1 immunoglobulin heavy chain junction region [Macaca mulatta]